MSDYKIADELNKIARSLTARRGDDERNLSDLLTDAIRDLKVENKIALVNAINSIDDFFPELDFMSMDTYLSEFVNVDDEYYEESMAGIDERDEYVYESQFKGFQSCGKREAEQMIDWDAELIAYQIIKNKRVRREVKKNIRWYPKLEEILNKIDD